MTLIDLIGLTAGILASISFLPQVITTYRTKQADDVSMSMLLLTFGSVSLYVVYAAFLSLWPVVLMNSIFTGLLVLEIVLKIKYGKK